MEMFSLSTSLPVTSHLNTHVCIYAVIKVEAIASINLLAWMRLHVIFNNPKFYQKRSSFIVLFPLRMRDNAIKTKQTNNKKEAKLRRALLQTHNIQILPEIWRQTSDGRN